jgi:ParB/RepB/Spo0J family partition protein
MAHNTTIGNLRDIPVNDIRRNPENPRIIFRQQELDELTESIRRYGVQVPIAVYREASKFVLIDGERRWRCSLKLNKRTIPAIIQDKPDALTNLVLMFNIHALREQWDLLTIALKLPRVIDLLAKKSGHSPNERELSEETGLARGTLRRCRLLVALPRRHVDVILAELKKPKSQQRLTEDFYIEMERALKTVGNRMPILIPNEERREQVRDVLMEKYRSGVIKSVTDFRKLAKIARADKVEADIETARGQLAQVFEANVYSIEQAFDASVSEGYEERDLLSHVNSLITDLESYEADAVDEEVEAVLRRLIRAAEALLEAER